ncbi:hypothetical protein ONZ45_g13004 [Pleurotus djamor]|nr:hypothetical protein ONZ45_g13004 [Pleurotus djamor]
MLRRISTSASRLHANSLGLLRKGAATTPQIPRRTPIVNHIIPNVQRVVALAGAKRRVGKSIVAGYVRGLSATQLHTSDGGQSYGMPGLIIQEAIHLLFSLTLIGVVGLILLVVDTPPGIGDVVWALWLLVDVDGTLVISAPQDVALPHCHVQESQQFYFITLSHNLPISSLDRPAPLINPCPSAHPVARLVAYLALQTPLDVAILTIHVGLCDALGFHNSSHVDEHITSSWTHWIKLKDRVEHYSGSTILHIAASVWYSSRVAVL